MCRRLGRKKLLELGMLNYDHRDCKIRAVPYTRRGFHRRRSNTEYLLPRPTFGLYIHEKMTLVPHRPLFFNYLTRMVWESCAMRDCLWDNLQSSEMGRQPRKAKLERWEKLERYDQRARDGRRVRDYTHAGSVRRQERLARQGVTQIRRDRAVKSHGESGSNQQEFHRPDTTIYPVRDKWV